MTALAREVKSLALRLPPLEREQLACALLASLDAPKEAEWDAAWGAEIERRLREHADGRDPAAPLEEVFARLRSASP